MDSQLRPRQDFAELIERAIAAWHGDEAIGEVGHQRLPLMHGFDDAQVRQPPVGDFAVDQ